jgi:hypothetical protein
MKNGINPQSFQESPTRAVNRQLRNLCVTPGDAWQK